MTNLEWLRTLSITDMAHELMFHKCSNYCLDGRCYKQDEFECTRGVLAYLSAEHEEPDSWERLEEDVAAAISNGPDGQFEGMSIAVPLVRRAKKLAGVE